MDKIKKLVLISFIVLFVLIFQWPLDPVMTLVLGFTYVTILIGALFEIKKYHNNSIYLAATALILILGLILTYIYTFNLNYMQDTNKWISFMLAIFVAGATFGMALIRVNSWKKTKMEMKT